LTRIIIFVCSIYVPPDKCGPDTALDVIYRDAPFGISGMAGQVEIAEDPRGLDWRHYTKIQTTR